VVRAGYEMESGFEANNLSIRSLDAVSRNRGGCGFDFLDSATLHWGKAE